MADSELNTEPGVTYGTPTKYEQHNFAENLEVVGIAFNHDRVWFCINGMSVFRAKVYKGKLVVEYHKPRSVKEAE